LSQATLPSEQINRAVSHLLRQMKIRTRGSKNLLRKAILLQNHSNSRRFRRPAVLAVSGRLAAISTHLQAPGIGKRYANHSPAM
jgi:hypothetical protein